ncbi:hypothetical protein OHB13_38270 (plasmid) [Streptomyces sp. NBC_00440]|uniref:DUF6197 family protein n=1 Tax=Streptomyces sp. NBC_00440 TaxID=2975741 RepID=UPI002E21F5DD
MTKTIFTDETLRLAAEAMGEYSRSIWVGPSGEQVTGEQVACHLEATRALLDRDGWVRTYTSVATSADRTGDETAVTDRLSEVLHLVRNAFGPGDLRWPLYSALLEISASADGDGDTKCVAGLVLDLVIQTHTGSDTAKAIAWSERMHRTAEDITALLMAGARFARAYGPGVIAEGLAAA